MSEQYEDVTDDAALDAENIAEAEADLGDGAMHTGGVNVGDPKP